DARKQAAERLTSILDGVDEGFVALDEGLVITDFNVAAEKMFGKNRNDATGKRFFDVFPDADHGLEPTLRAAIRQRHAKALEAQILDNSPNPRRISVRLFPHAAGVSLFCQSQREEGVK